MIFTERIEKLLAANHIKEVIEEFLRFINEVPQSERDAKNDANQLRGQVIILSSRFTDLNTRINTNTIDQASANHEKAVLINSFVQILNQLPSSHPDLNNYIAEKNEEDEWQEAQRKNTIEEYRDYFSKYPNGKYKAATIKLIAELEDVKQKQDAEIKRLAALEKERRENDKVTNTEPQKTSHTEPKARQAYSTTGNAAVAARPKSKAGLYVALGVLIGIVFIIVLAVSMSSSEKAGPQPQPQPAPLVSDSGFVPQKPIEDNNNEAAKAALKMAFEMANETVINAGFYMNAASLNKSFTGEALKTLRTRIEALVTSDSYVQSVLEKRKYKNIQLTNNQTEGQVEVDEVWTYTYYSNATKLCMGKQPNYKASLTAYFKKTDNGWMVTSFTTTNEKIPETVLCD
jgi:Effector-associated domain 11